MAFGVKVLADSVNSCTGVRLTTLEMTYPRPVHPEHLRHRAMSFNVASSRAIPVQKMLSAVCEDPFVPIHFGAAQKGMQAYDEIPVELHGRAREIVLRMRDACVAGVEELLEIGLHKQFANRYLEAWAWVTVICTAVDRAWGHFDSLRCHHAAEPHIRKIAEMSRDARDESTPNVLKHGEWHLPLFGFPGDELITDAEEKIRISSGRCARVSYMTHEGIRDLAADFGLSDSLITNRHFSPTEHQAQALTLDEYIPSNFDGGWQQWRKTLIGEYTER